LDFRIVIAIALVLVLFSSVYSLDAFAAHTDAGNEKKSAYLFSIQGNGFSRVRLWSDYYQAYMADNNGVSHESAYNYMDPDYIILDQKKLCEESVELSDTWDRCVKHWYPTNAHSGYHFTWHNIVDEYAAAFDKEPLKSAKDRNAKIIMFGYSFGGGSTTFIVDDDRNSNVIFDLVYLVDPVGSGTTRYGIEFECSKFPAVVCPSNADARVFGSNVKKVIAPYQKYSWYPVDLANDLDDWGPENIITVIPYTCKGDGNCHSNINSEKAGKAKVDAFVNSMNTKPHLEVPNTIIINPGESIKVQAFDPLTSSDNNPTLKFRLSPATPDELNPIPGSEITVNTNRLAGSWALVENPGSAKQFDVNILNTEFMGIPTIDVVALGEDNAVQRRTWNGLTWLDWGIIGDSNNPILAKEMFVSKNLLGTSRDVWAIDNDGAVQRKFWAGPWVPFSFDGFAEKIAATSVADKLKVWVIDSEGAVRHKWRDGGTSWEPGDGMQSWDNFSVPDFAKEIFVTTYRGFPGSPISTYDVWIIDNDGVVKRKSGTSFNWSGWESLDGSADTSGFGGNTRYDVWILTTNNDVQHKWGDGTSWSEWESLGTNARDIFVTTVTIPFPQTTIHDVWIIDSNDAVQNKVWDGTSWSEWELFSDSGFATEIVVTPEIDGPGQIVWIIDNDGAVHNNRITRESGILHTAEFSPDWPAGTYNVELIVEDNGWPCDYCTGSNQAAARGALGKWDVKTIELIVRGGGGGVDSDPLGPWDPLDPNDPRNMRIPSWIKFIAEQWSKGLIGDAEFANAIRFLVNSNVIVIPDLPEAGQADRDDIPQWIKFNAEQWVNGALSDTEFVSGIKWIIENGIIQLN